MKIKEYDTNELLMIANNVTGEYSDKQVRQAKEELYRRGVEDKVIADIMEEKEEAFMRRLDAAALAEQALLSWTPVDFSDMFRELRRLKEEKYDLKFKQRLTALIAGDLIYFTGVWYYFISPNL